LIRSDVENYAAYCGLYCGTCIHASPDREGCSGCLEGGGAADCFQRSCCQARGLEGCWQCDEFPCSQGFFGAEEWKGLCIGCCSVIRKVGVEQYTRLVRDKMGELVELGDYRYKSVQEIEGILLNDE
jgi:hypothetical protein